MYCISWHHRTVCRSWKSALNFPGYKICDCSPVAHSPSGRQPSYLRPYSSAVTINMQQLPALTVLLLLSCCAEYSLAQLCSVATTPPPELKPFDNDAGRRGNHNIRYTTKRTYMADSCSRFPFCFFFSFFFSLLHGNNIITCQMTVTDVYATSCTCTWSVIPYRM